MLGLHPKADKNCRLKILDLAMCKWSFSRFSLPCCQSHPQFSEHEEKNIKFIAISSHSNINSVKNLPSLCYLEDLPSKTSKCVQV